MRIKLEKFPARPVSSDSDTTRSVLWPHLYPKVVSVENVNGRAGDDDVRRSIQLIGPSARRADDGRCIRRARLDDDHSVIVRVDDVKRVVVHNLHA